MWLRKLWIWLRGLFCEISVPDAPGAESREEQGEGEFFRDPLWESYDPGRPLLYQRMQEKEPMSSYRYCGVVFYKADIVYHYLYEDPELKVGDRVLVPVHIRGNTQTAEGMVVSAGEYLEDCVPHPLGQTSHVIRKL